MPFMNKLLKSAQLITSRLQNRYLKNRSEFNKFAYNKQRNYCLFANLDEKDATYKKQLWKVIKPMQNKIT